MKPCNTCCPWTLHEDAQYGIDMGCLPSPWDIAQMLADGEVHMCHSNPAKPCIATGLSAVPSNYTAQPVNNYCPIDTLRTSNAMPVEPIVRHCLA